MPDVRLLLKSTRHTASCYQLVNTYYTSYHSRIETRGWNDSIRTGVGEILENGCNNNNLY